MSASMTMEAGRWWELAVELKPVSLQIPWAGVEVIRSAWCTFISPASLQAENFTHSQTRQVSTPFAVLPGE